MQKCLSQNSTDRLWHKIAKETQGFFFYNASLMGHYKEGKKESCFSRQRRWGFGCTVTVSTVLWPVPHMFYVFSGTVWGTDAWVATTGGLLIHCNVLQSVWASASCCCCCGRRMWLLSRTTFTISESICLQHKSSQKSTLMQKIKGSLFPIAICVKILKYPNQQFEKKNIFLRRCIRCIMVFFQLAWLRCPAFIMVKVMPVLGHIHPSNATEA